MTDRTSMSIRLNSSKQHQAPEVAKPEKNLPIIYLHKATMNLIKNLILENGVLRSYSEI